NAAAGPEGRRVGQRDGGRAGNAVVGAVGVAEVADVDRIGAGAAIDRQQALDPGQVAREAAAVGGDVHGVVAGPAVDRRGLAQGLDVERVGAGVAVHLDGGARVVEGEVLGQGGAVGADQAHHAERAAGVGEGDGLGGKAGERVPTVDDIAVAGRRT